MSDRRRRVDLRDAAVGALAVVMLAAISVVGWWVYATWRVGEIELTTEGQPLIVQVFEASSDTPVGEAFELSAARVVALPEGEYRLRERLGAAGADLSVSRESRGATGARDFARRRAPSGRRAGAAGFIGEKDAAAVADAVCSNHRGARARAGAVGVHRVVDGFVGLPRCGNWQRAVGYVASHTTF